MLSSPPASPATARPVRRDAKKADNDTDRIIGGSSPAVQRRRAAVRDTMLIVRRRNLISSLALALVVAATSCGKSASPTSPGTANPEATRRVIAVLGDSLAVSPSRAESFPAVLQARLTNTHPGWTIRNEGIIGDTTSDGVRRSDAALTADTAILILELGANDGLRGDSIASIEANLGTMIERAQAKQVRVLLCGMETLPFNGLNYAVQFHNLFPRVAVRYNVPLVPFLLEGVALIPEYNLQDGIHPNAAGARIIAETVWPYLQPLVQQLTVQ